MNFQSLFVDEALNRYRPMWVFFQMAVFSIGLLSWMAGGVGVNSFSPETWGAWACQFPAAAWAGTQMSAAALTMGGLFRPVSRWKVIIGASVQALQFGALAYSAVFTGGQFVISVWPILFLVPAHLTLAWQGYRYVPR